MDLREWLLRDGDTVEATGRVVALEGAVWFEPPLPRHLIYYLPGSEPAPRFSGLGVPVTGVDLAALERRFEKDGALEGLASLRGLWVGNGLKVVDQGPPRANDEPVREWADPPGAAPESGWPHGRANANLDVPGDLVADPAVVGVLMVRPSETQVVLTVVSTDPDAIRARWSATFPDRLCVIKSRWTREQVESTRNLAQQQMTAWQAYTSGPSFDDDCQPHISVNVVRVVPDLVAAATRLPEGLLAVESWLRPDYLSS